MLQTTINKGHIKGVLTELIPRGISHIQYANDIVIMIEASNLSIRNLKRILYCFECLTGLKINFHKSEVYVFGVSQVEQENWVTCLTVLWEAFQ